MSKTEKEVDEIIEANRVRRSRKIDRRIVEGTAITRYTYSRGARTINNRRIFIVRETHGNYVCVDTSHDPVYAYEIVHFSNCR